MTMPPMPSMRNAVLYGIALSLLACALWALSTPAARTFVCTFRNLCLLQKTIEVVAASLEDGPGQPAPTTSRPRTSRPPRSPPRIREGVVAPMAARGLIDVNDYPSDLWAKCLTFVDQASLVNVEMTAKTLPAQLDEALNDAWDDQDKRIDLSVRAEGETARDRAIGSYPAYRIQMLARFAKIVEAAKPSGSQAVQPSLGMGLGDEHEIYVRISDRKGQDHLGSFLAGGVVKPSDFSEWLPWTMGGMNSIFLEFSKDDLRRSSWRSMRQFLNGSSKGFAQQYQHDPDTLKRGMVEALGDAAVTVVAVHRTTLSLSIIMACDNVTGAERYQALSYNTDLGPVLQASTTTVYCSANGNDAIESMSMNISSWDSELIPEMEGDEDEGIVSEEGNKATRFVTFFSKEGRLGIEVSTKPTHGRRCYCLHRFCLFLYALTLLTLIWIHKHGGIFHSAPQVSLVFVAHLIFSGEIRCAFHASNSIWDFFLRFFFPCFFP